MPAPDPVPRRHFASMLWRLADLTQVDERRRSFRAKAYRRALWSLDDLPEDLDLPKEEMLDVPGIGSGLVSLIEEYSESGGLRRLETLQARYPEEVARMRRLPRLNQKVLRVMKEELGVETLADLEALIDAEGVSALPGVGEATVALWRRILDLAPGPVSVPAHRAWVTGVQLGEHLERRLDLLASETGAIRRVEDWVDEIEVAVATEDPPRVIAFFESSAIPALIESSSDEQVAFSTHDGHRARVHMTPPADFGAGLVRTTGPASHLAEVFPEGVPSLRTEPEVYDSVGLSWIPPAARARPVGEAESLITVADLRGDLHVHTDWSPDGRVSLEDLARAAAGHGYSYLLVTDHTKGLRFGGLDEEALAVQAALVDGVRDRVPEIAILHGAELNIELDGNLDIDDRALGLLDFAVAAIHSRFDLDEGPQTKRVIAAMRHPRVKVLAHPLGRRIGIRPPLQLDVAALIEVAAEEKVALELNGHRDRLDLPAEFAEQALESGCLLATNSDAHRLGELGNVENAVATAQRAGAQPSQVVNTWEGDVFRSWFEVDQ